MGPGEKGKGSRRDREHETPDVAPTLPEADPETTTRLWNAATSCRSRLQRLSELENSERATDAAPDFWASQQCAEFNLWCFKIGVDRKGAGSLHVRLKDVPGHCQIFTRLLQWIERDLKDLEQPAAEGLATLPETPADNVTKRDVESDSSSGSDSGSFLSLPPIDGFKDPTAGLNPAEQRKAKLRKQIENDIGQLHDHALFLAQSATKHRQSRLQLYLQKDGPRVAYEAFKTIAMHQARNQFPSATESFITRMAESFARRRIKFGYLREHQRKRAREEAHPVEPSASRPDAGPTAAEPDVVPEQGQSPQEKIKEFKNTQSVYQRTIPSATEVTRLEPAPVRELQKRPESVASVVIRRAEFPPPPRFTGNTFECPYCHMHFRAIDAEPRRWTQHVLEDFEPYFCTVEDCEDPFGFPSTFDGLMSHLQTHLPLRYHLDMPDGEHQEVNREDELEDQIRTAEAGSPPSQGPLNALKRGAHQRGVYMFFSCPFCNGYPDVPQKNGFDDPSKPESQGQLRHHVKEHMQQIMLFLPPYREDILDGADDVEGSTSAGRRSSGEAESESEEEIPMACGRDDCGCEGFKEFPVDELVLEDERDFWAAILLGTGLYERSAISNECLLKETSLRPFVERWKSQARAENTPTTRIAILDSGLELSEFRKYCYDVDPKIEYRSRINDCSEPKDEVGHGAPNPVAQEFAAYLKNYIETENCYGLARGLEDLADRRPFVPRFALNQFWTEERLREFLESNCVTSNATSSSIPREFLTIFSILVFTNHADNIQDFISRDINDNELPIDPIAGKAAGKSDSWKDLFDRPMMQDFFEAQWRFCPLTIGIRSPWKPEISARRIIPILNMEKLWRALDRLLRRAVEFYKISWAFHCSDPQTPSTLTLKIYTRASGMLAEMWHKETENYFWLPNYARRHVVQCYGSFVFRDRLFLVLERLDGRSLADIFEGPKPSTKQASFDFWDEFFKLFGALEAIQERNPSQQETTEYIMATHIFVSDGFPLESFDVKPFKFTDIGSIIYETSKKGAVLSMGGIASEALIWSIGGHERQQSYSVRRTGVLAKHGPGREYLDVVLEEHERALRDFPQVGGLSQGISDIILQKMPGGGSYERSSPIDVYIAWETLSSSLPEAIAPTPAMDKRPPSEPESNKRWSVVTDDELSFSEYQELGEWNSLEPRAPTPPIWVSPETARILDMLGRPDSGRRWVEKVHGRGVWDGAAALSGPSQPADLSEEKESGDVDRMLKKKPDTRFGEEFRG